MVRGKPGYSPFILDCKNRLSLFFLMNHRKRSYMTEQNIITSQQGISRVSASIPGVFLEAAAMYLLPFKKKQRTSRSMDEQLLFL